MWTTETSIVTSAPPDAVWHVWLDVTHWNEWVEPFEWVTLDGPFAAGTWGMLKLRSGTNFFQNLASKKAHPWVLLDVVTNQTFKDRAPQFGGDMYFIHMLEPHNSGSKISLRIEIKGFLSWLYGLLIGSVFKTKLPQAAQRLAQKAEQYASGQGG
ncbi:MAG TPA: SRPBCC family protein [Pyrinomonadaceae bacterium]|jgi:hypothetical protein